MFTFLHLGKTTEKRTLVQFKLEVITHNGVTYLHFYFFAVPGGELLSSDYLSLGQKSFRDLTIEDETEIANKYASMLDKRLLRTDGKVEFILASDEMFSATSSLPKVRRMNISQIAFHEISDLFDNFIDKMVFMQFVHNDESGSYYLYSELTYRGVFLAAVRLAKYLKLSFVGMTSATMKTVTFATTCRQLKPLKDFILVNVQRNYTVVAMFLKGKLADTQYISTEAFDQKIGFRTDTMYTKTGGVVMCLLAKHEFNYERQPVSDVVLMYKSVYKNKNLDNTLMSKCELSEMVIDDDRIIATSLPKDAYFTDKVNKPFGGFTLVEVVVSLAVAAIAIAAGLVGVVSVAHSQTQQITEEGASLVLGNIHEAFLIDETNPIKTYYFMNYTNYFYYVTNDGTVDKDYANMPSYFKKTSSSGSLSFTKTFYPTNLNSLRTTPVSASAPVIADQAAYYSMSYTYAKSTLKNSRTNVTIGTSYVFTVNSFLSKDNTPLITESVPFSKVVYAS